MRPGAQRQHHRPPQRGLAKVFPNSRASSETNPAIFRGTPTRWRDAGAKPLGNLASDVRRHPAGRGRLADTLEKLNDRERHFHKPAAAPDGRGSRWRVHAGWTLEVPPVRQARRQADAGHLVLEGLRRVTWRGRSARGLTRNHRTDGQAHIPPRTNVEVVGKDAMTSRRLLHRAHGQRGPRRCPGAARPETST
jgi:hypothetical protein